MGVELWDIMQRHMVSLPGWSLSAVQLHSKASVLDNTGTSQVCI